MVSRCPLQTPDNLKTSTGEEAFNNNGLAQRSIALLKDKFPDLEVYTDVALDPYNSDGHDGTEVSALANRVPYILQPVFATIAALCSIWCVQYAAFTVHRFQLQY